MAVRSAVMEHYKSTLATTAIAVFGLVVAAHTLHPGNYEVQPRVARIAVAPAGSSTWMDPPARMAGVSKPEARMSEIARATSSDLLAPQMTALPAGAVTAAALPSEMIAPAEKSRTALTAHRPKLADRSPRRMARLRHAALARTAAAEPAVAAPSTPAPAPTPKKIDPIGDLIRGLGLGHDSEG
ncbi:hypothetical protein [Methylobacterium sp. J-077]|uniref:hypothetical protein n=1 Tax=Methylobacterium sp. J-077 TaxID=2836656 RepID=UPI001FB9740D|nr:hypothetical protein [Methylobacterium sp. J-077]MCJ2125324.1 hypothetical protein [Methylobacterium sp. J-077]